MTDQELPLFDLTFEPQRTVTRRPGHTIRAHNTPGRWLIVCGCGDTSGTKLDPDSATQWAYTHVGVAYDTDVRELVES